MKGISVCWITQQYLCKVYIPHIHIVIYVCSYQQLILIIHADTSIKKEYEKHNMIKTHLPINNLEDRHVSERTVNKIFLI